ncbi:MAG: tRNA 5-methylaminomethyl-2-thiouridine biosynthesis bifunctional protein MnmC [Betaproteobacteria bacterium ADurb.Bin341]|nr:MAG: tRNA 5-methylaminomethyl-2-thiouridine biosynthesis bifunctional protein MnmC [Betaproteobacteria bacterium ADurb.Bin341]
MTITPAQLSFEPDGTPYSARYNDVYHTRAGGPEQARHVFLAGNDLPARWQNRPKFTLLETGFGLGLNFLTTWMAWQNDPQRCLHLHFISVEKHPVSADDLAKAHATWPEFEPYATQLRQCWPALEAGNHRIELAKGQMILDLILGDALEALTTLQAQVDAFYLDGFAPDKNPELWSPALFKTLAKLAAPGATLATWSVAGHVQRGLNAAGFVTEKHPGFAGKRQMLAGARL